MAHLHEVIDTDRHFKIDPITRNIVNESGKSILMQNDHNSERFTFEIPRYIDGHDMMLCNTVQVHYVNKQSGNRYQNADIYTVDDLRVSSIDEDTIMGSWLVSMNATTFEGSLEFILRFACISKTGVIEYQWFSNICALISIEKGIFNAEVVTNADDRDVLAQWKQSILEEVMPNVVSVVVEANKTLAEVNEKITETEFSPNFETGNLEYESPAYDFKVNTDTGNLEWEVI